MSFLWMVVVGLIIGAIFKVLISRSDSGALAGTLILGVTGSVLAGGLGWAEGWYEPAQPVGFIAGAIGAVVLLALFRTTVRQEAPAHRDLRRAA